MFSPGITPSEWSNRLRGVPGEPSLQPAEVLDQEAGRPLDAAGLRGLRAEDRGQGLRRRHPGQAFDLFGLLDEAAMKPATNETRKFRLVTKFEHRHSDGLVGKGRARLLAKSTGCNPAVNAVQVRLLPLSPLVAS